LKLIENQFQGDGSALLKTERFFIIMYNPYNGQTSMISQKNFNNMGNAYLWYITICKKFWMKNGNEWEFDFMLVANDMPLISTTEWTSEINYIMMGWSV
jgi:hypothetical protein